MKRDANIPGSNPPDQWFIAIGATVFEYSLERLKTDVQNGTLQRHALVWCATLCKWVRVDDEPWLRSMLPELAHRQPLPSLPPPPRLGDFLQASLGRRPPALPLPSLPPVPPSNPELALAAANDDKTLRVSEGASSNRLGTAASRGLVPEDADDTQRVSPESASKLTNDVVDSDDFGGDTRVEPLEFDEVTTVRHSLLEDLRAQAPMRSPEQRQSRRTPLPVSKPPRAVTKPGKPNNPNNPSSQPARLSLPPPVLPVRKSRPASTQTTHARQSLPPPLPRARSLPPVPTPPTLDGPAVREPSIAPSDGSSVFTQHDLAPAAELARSFDSRPAETSARPVSRVPPEQQSLTTALSLILPMGRGSEGTKRRLGVVVGSLSAGALLLFGLFALGRELTASERPSAAQLLVHPALPLELPSKTSAAPTSSKESGASEPNPQASTAPKLASELELASPDREPSLSAPKSARRLRAATSGRAASARRRVAQQPVKPAEPANQLPKSRAARDYWTSPGF